MASGNPRPTAPRPAPRLAPPGAPYVGGAPVSTVPPRSGQGVQQFVKPANLAAVPAASTSPQFKIEWPTDAHIIALYATAFDPSGALIAMEAVQRLQLQIDIQGFRNMVTNGQSADFVTIGAICPWSSPAVPVDLRVRASDTWLVSFKNLDPVLPLVPDLVFTTRWLSKQPSPVGR